MNNFLCNYTGECIPLPHPDCQVICRYWAREMVKTLQKAKKSSCHSESGELSVAAKSVDEFIDAYSYLKESYTQMTQRRNEALALIEEMREEKQKLRLQLEQMRSILK